MVKTGAEVAARQYSGEMSARAPAIAGVDDPRGRLMHAAALDPMYGNDVDVLMGGIVRLPGG